MFGMITFRILMFGKINFMCTELKFWEERNSDFKWLEQCHLDFQCLEE